MFRRYNSSNIDSRDKLLLSPQFLKIQETLTKIHASGVSVNFPGNCISTAEMLQSVLQDQGIETQITEVQLVITRNTGLEAEYLFVGYDNQSFAGQIDTHVVLITKTEQPILIDASLGHVLPTDHPWVVEYLPLNHKVEMLAEYTVANLHLAYTRKKIPRLANLHEKTILQKTLDDLSLRRDLRTIRFVVFIAIGIGMINFTLNMTLIILKSIFP
jgi:hypothetical protein